MGKVYIITSSTTMCMGHGESGSIITLPETEAYSGKPNPAFKTKGLAESYIRKNGEWRSWDITELDLIE